MKAYSIQYNEKKKPRGGWAFPGYLPVFNDLKKAQREASSQANLYDHLDYRVVEVSVRFLCPYKEEKA